MKGFRMYTNCFAYVPFFFILLWHSVSFGICHLNIEPEKLNSNICPGISTTASAKSVDQLIKSLGRIYHSQQTQTNLLSCRKMADMMAAVCQGTQTFDAYFVTPKTGIVQSTYRGIGSNDYRYKTSATVGEANLISAAEAIAANNANQTCREPGRSAFSFSSTCAAVSVCEDLIQNYYLFESKDGQPFNVYISRKTGGLRVNVTGLSGVSVLQIQPQPDDGDISISTNTMFSVVPKSQKNLVTYNFRGNCNLGSKDPINLYFDRSYVAGGGSEISPRSSLVDYCADGISMCETYKGPLLSQASTDLLQLVRSKTKIKNPADIGFCAPTTLAMTLIGLKDQSKAVFGGSVDSGAVFKDPLDQVTGNGFASAVYRSGQLLGTDWWVGGSPSEQNAAVLKANLGEASGTVREFLNIRGGYTNQNMMNFTNKTGGLVQMTLAMDSTNGTSGGTWHSLMMAGHAGGHLKMYDPWGRIYLVDMEVKRREAIFYQINQAMFNYDDGSGKSFKTPSFACSLFGGSCVATYSFSTTPKVGDIYPAWWWLQSGSQEAINEFERIGAVTKIVRTGTDVPHVKHLSGDQGFVYYSPSGEAQMLPGQEVAMVNPGKGKFFDAAEAQNVIDLLDGSIQRVKGAWQAKCKYEPSENEIQKVIESGGTSISFNAPPRFLIDPISNGINEGKSITLKAIVVGCPKPTLQWTFNGSPIANANTDTLVLSNVTKGNQGKYALIATNSVGASISASADLKVNSLSDVQQILQGVVGTSQTISSSVAQNWYNSGLSTNLMIGVMTSQYNDITKAYLNRVNRSASTEEVVSRMGNLFTSYENIFNSIRTATLPMSPFSMEVKPGQVSTFTYNWSAIPIGGNLKVLVKFVNSSGQTVAIDDHALPFSSSVWLGTVSYQRNFTLPSSLVPGVYDVVLGLVNADSGVSIALDPGPGVSTRLQNTLFNVGYVYISDPNANVISTIVNTLMLND